MPRPHVPDLDALAQLEDEEIKFYASIGVLMSLFAALEQTWFRVFEKGLGLTTEICAGIYFEVRSDEARFGMADTAMTQRLTGQRLQTWKGLAKRMRADEAAVRNLVGHNPVGRDVTVFIGRPTSTQIGPILGFTQPAIMEIPHIVRHRVKQDPVQVAWGKRKQDEADFARVRKACESLHQLHHELDAFLETVPARRPRSSRQPTRAKKALPTKPPA